jgi:hypothetical protein
MIAADRISIVDDPPAHREGRNMLYDKFCRSSAAKQRFGQFLRAGRPARKLTPAA